MANCDYILCECQLQPLEEFVASLESSFVIQMARMPKVFMTMIQAEDSVEAQPFYLGEALTTDCEVIVNGRTGYGICLGDEPVRCYCIAFIDAIKQLDGEHQTKVRFFLEEQAVLVNQELKVEYDHILRTRVDFKLMEQE
jgi:phosphonate C-P lyase system protein PhnG